MGKIIVFGGSGFLGSHVADELTKKGHDVTIFDIIKSKYLNSNQKMIVGDILNQKSVKEAIDGADYVYHFAAIADIYEALTAADRPYKEGKKLSQAMRIMGFMKNDYHIDEDLFEIFVNSGVYKKYAEDHVASNQIDQIDEKAVLGTK